MPATMSSNSVGLTYAEEVSLKVLANTPVWYPLEPNTYSNFGGDLKTVSREPINATRQKLKGTVTDLDVTAGFNIDFTQNNLTRLLQGFFFSTAHEKVKTMPLNGTQVPLTSVAAGSFGAASGLAGFKVGSIVQSRNFTNAQNNRLNRVTAAAAAALTVATYNPNATSVAMVAEAAPPAAAAIDTVGFALSGDVKLYVPGSNSGATTQPYLSSAATVDFTTLGLLPGEWVYLGDINDDLTDTGATEFNFIVGTARNRGFCRIAPAGISAHMLQFDLAIGSSMWVPSGSGDGSVAISASSYVSLYFGTVIRNEPTAAAIIRRTYTLQRYLGKGVGNQDMLEYVAGAVPNEFTMNIPSNAKLATDMTFVGMDTQQQYAATLPGTYATGPSGEDAFNTSQNVFVQLLYIVNAALADSTPLFGYASDQKLTINNNTKPDKAIGVIGAFEATSGNFDVSGTLTCYFDDIAAQQAVRNNTDVGLVDIYTKDSSGMIFDLPLLTLGLNGLKVEKDKPIEADITQSASPGTSNYTLLHNKFSFLPASAMANYQG